MRKIFLTLSLSLILAASTNAGETPISGVVGCAPGLWYPESQECVLEFSAPVQTTKPEPTVLDTTLVKAFLHIRSMIF